MVFPKNNNLLIACLVKSLDLLSDTLPLYVEFIGGVIGPDLFELVSKECCRWSAAIRCAEEPSVSKFGLEMTIFFCEIKLLLDLHWYNSGIKVLLKNAETSLPDYQRNQLTGEIRQFLDTILRLVSQSQEGQRWNIQYTIFVKKKLCTKHGDVNNPEAEKIGKGSEAMSVALGDWCLENEVKSENVNYSNNNNNNNNVSINHHHNKNNNNNNKNIKMRMLLILVLMIHSVLKYSILMNIINIHFL